MKENHISNHPSLSKSGPKKTQWHPPFCASIRLELIKDKEKLEYYMEYGLNTKPLLMDLLVIKKKKEAKLESEIGQLFKIHNILEYKSPDDALNFDVFFKTIGCALLYKSSGKIVNEINIHNITITFIRERKPVKLIKELKQEGLSADKKTAGIYEVNFPILGGIYILVTRELDVKKHIWLTSLSDHMCEENARTLLKEVGKLTQKDDKEYADAVLQIAMERNKELFNREKEDADMCEAFWELFQPEIEAEKRNSELCGEKRGKKQGIEIGEYTKLISQICRKIQRGKDIASISDALEESEDVIRPIYDAVLASPNLSAGQIYEQIFAKQSK